MTAASHLTQDKRFVTKDLRSGMSIDLFNAKDRIRSPFITLFHREETMIKFVTPVVILVSVLATPSVWAGASLDIELAKAKAIVELNNKLTNATTTLTNAIATQADATTQANLQKAVEDAQIALDQAVKGAFSGTTLEGVKHAQELLNNSDLVDKLRASLTAAGLDRTAKETLQRALELAQSNLMQSLTETTELKRIKDIADQRFAGFNFGVALGVTIKAGKRDLVQSASLDANRIVRIDRDNNTTANLILETHYFFTPPTSLPSWLGGIEAKDWGHGPFIAIQPGTENIIQSVGAGWMIGFKRSTIVARDIARDRGDSFNLGIGVMVNPNAQVLGDGLQKNQQLPAGETTVRLRKTTEMGYLAIFSYTF